jgi:hypothetical protein
VKRECGTARTATDIRLHSPKRTLGRVHVINLQPPWLADGVFGENIRASRNNLPVDCFAADLNDLSGALVNREIDGEYGGLLTH